MSEDRDARGCRSGMVYSVAASVVALVHFLFIVFIALGGLLALRWLRTLWIHLPSVAWGLAIVVIGFTCPLTPLEKHLRERAGETAYEGGFIDHYLTDVIYPGDMIGVARTGVAIAVVATYVAVLAHHRRRRHPVV